MKITSLVLRNFLGHESTSLDFSKVSSLAIVGVNGSGKSSLIDAIIWCLYGKITARGTKSDSVARHGSSETTVVLTWEQNNIKYQLTRTRNNEKNTQKLELLVNDEPVSSRKKTEVESLISEIVKIPLELYQITNGLQQESKSFLDLKPSDRKAYLSQILQLEKYKNLQLLAKNKKTELIAIKNNLLGQQQTVTSSISQYEEELQQEVFCKEKYNQIVEKKNKVDLFLSKAQDQQIEHKQKNFLEKEKYKNLLSIKEDQLSNIIEKINSLGDVREFNHLEKQIEEINTNLASIKETMVSLSETFSQKKEELVSINTNIKNYNHTIELAKKLNCNVPCQTCLQDIPEEHVNKTIKYYENLVEENTVNSNILTNELQKIKDQKLILDEKQNILIKQKNEINTEIQQIHRDNDLIKDYIQQKNNLTKEINSLTDKISQIDAVAVSPEILNKIDMAEKTKKEIEIELTYALKKINHFETLKDLISKYKIENVQIADQLNENTNEIQTYNLIIDACHPQKGIPAKIIENSLFPLEKITNDLLAYFPGDTKFSIYFQTLTEDGKETLELLVKSSATPYDRYYEQLSGGEKMRINLALRVALIRMVCNIYNVENRTLIIDEGFHALSADIRGTVFEILSSLLNVWFDKIFIVTHSPEISDLIPYKLELKKDTVKDKSVIAFKNF